MHLNFLCWQKLVCRNPIRLVTVKQIFLLVLLDMRGGGEGEQNTCLFHKYYRKNGKNT